MIPKPAAFSALMALTLAASPFATADDSHARRAEAANRPGILGTASAAGNFRTLVNAIVAANLFDDLRADGPFTVFAPTDEAFDKLPKDAIESLLKPENRPALRKLLTLHVVPGRITAEALASHGSPKTLAGVKLTIASNRNGLAVNEATVLKADIACRNGLIHVIDRVLMPTASPTDLIGLASSKKSFSTLVAAVKAAGLEEALRSDGPFTVFAPTDEAFAKIPKETLESLLKPENRGKLGAILKLHVVPSKLEATQVAAAGKLRTLAGQSIPVSIDEGRLVVGGAKVIATDIKADNGIIHAIDAVLMPE
jgi:uncharacterized surface protein with fasciclin (FAS1) repeats